MIRVYAKATFAFGKPGDITRPLTVCAAGEITDIPDWCAKDLTYKMAVKSGEVEVLKNHEEEVKAELEIAKNPVKKPATSRKKVVDEI